MQNNPPQAKYSKALPAPSTSTTIIGTGLIQQVVEGSKASPRKRIILPLHKSPESTMHRMLNALQPYSYIQPHSHLYPPKPESVIVLQGAILCFFFSPTGQVEELHTLAAGSANFGVDSEPGVFHTFLALVENTVLFEVKPGPYEQSSDKDFAPWAPKEGTPEVKGYMENLYTLGKDVPSSMPLKAVNHTSQLKII